MMRDVGIDGEEDSFYGDGNVIDGDGDGHVLGGR